MNKKELKFYEAPACDVVELKLQGVLCGSGDVEGVENPGDITGGNEDPGF
jgi:hypothetical protein